ncbi:MAG: MFS transporter [Eubacterium sp.]|nr:MFS transporter [Candidatus Colimonas fimequi]
MNKLSLRDKLGYGGAAYSDSVSYSLVGTFLLFFLTTVAGIQPAIAGVILAIGTIADACFNPVMGYISDNIRTKWGRRVPFLVVFGTGLFVTLTLLFTSVHGPSWFKSMYYGLFTVLFWLSFTGFYIPFTALGAEITQDYNERTKLRSFASFTNLVGSLIAMSLPTLMVDFMERLGMTEGTAWMITAGLIGLTAMLGVIATALIGRKYDLPAGPDDPPAAKLNLAVMIREYIEVLKLGPIKYLVLTSFMFLIGYEFMLSDLLYYLTYNWSMDSVGISATLMFRCIMGIALVPIFSWAAQRTDKKTTLIASQIIAAVALCVCQIIGVGTYAWLGVLIIFVAVIACGYWQLMPAMVYDLCEYDQLENGVIRQGTIVSAHGLVESISSGIGAALLGLVLQFAGFNGEAATQTAIAENWIAYCLTYIPALFLVLSCLMLWKYPITRAVYDEICRKLAERK